MVVCSARAPCPGHGTGLVSHRIHRPISRYSVRTLRAGSCISCRYHISRHARSAACHEHGGEKPSMRIYPRSSHLAVPIESSRSSASLTNHTDTLECPGPVQEPTTASHLLQTINYIYLTTHHSPDGRLCSVAFLTTTTPVIEPSAVSGVTTVLEAKLPHIQPCTSVTTTASRAVPARWPDPPWSPHHLQYHDLQRAGENQNFQSTGTRSVFTHLLPAPRFHIFPRRRPADDINPTS